MRNRIGGKEVEGILIRDEGILDQLDILKKKDLNPLENLAAMQLKIGVLSGNWEEVAKLKYVDIFGKEGKRLIEAAVGDASLEFSTELLESLIIQATVQMKTEPAKTAMFSPSNSDLAAAGKLGMIKVRMSSEPRQPEDDAMADRLSRLVDLIDKG